MSGKKKRVELVRHCFRGSKHHSQHGLVYVRRRYVLHMPESKRIPRFNIMEEVVQRGKGHYSPVSDRQSIAIYRGTRVVVRGSAYAKSELHEYLRRSF